MTGLRAAIIGGGGTGAAIAHDLTQRGVSVTLFERGELTSGTTGRHHGLLHSGARYVVKDPAVALECIREVEVLRRIAPDSIEMNYGLFVALTDEDVAYGREFVDACAEVGIPVRRLETSTALKHEPSLNPEARFAMLVPDGTIDAYRLPLQFFATAKNNGAEIRNFSEIVDIVVEAGRVSGVVCHDFRSGKEALHAADFVINAAGPWAGRVAESAGVSLGITPSPGTLVAVEGRLCNMVMSHLHTAGEGDIIVPQRNISIIGTTEWRTETPDGVQAREGDTEFLLRSAEQLVPGFSSRPVHATWTAVRPLAGVGSDPNTLSRGFETVATENVKGFFSVIGGKATILRAMAEQASDVICDAAGIKVACETATTPLHPHEDFFRNAS